MRVRCCRGFQTKPKTEDMKMAKKASAGAKTAGKASELKTGTAKVQKAAKAKPKKGGAELIKNAETASALSNPSNPQREQMKSEYADAVSRLSEQVDKAEAALNKAKDVLKQDRQEFNKLSDRLRAATKILADLTGGRPVPRDLFSE